MIEILCKCSWNEIRV